jgi:hypothetical protein
MLSAASKKLAAFVFVEPKLECREQQEKSESGE